MNLMAGIVRSETPFRPWETAPLSRPFTPGQDQPSLGSAQTGNAPQWPIPLIRRHVPASACHVPVSGRIRFRSDCLVPASSHVKSASGCQVPASACMVPASGQFEIVSWKQPPIRNHASRDHQLTSRGRNHASRDHRLTARGRNHASRDRRLAARGRNHAGLDGHGPSRHKNHSKKDICGLDFMIVSLNFNQTQ